jgi:hypothetical protein
MRNVRNLTLGLLLCGLLTSGCTQKPARSGSIVASSSGAVTASIDPTTDLHTILEDVAAHFHLKLDRPHDLHGQTSIALRDVTWRQIFKVTLTPVGYDFYERDGVVVIRSEKTIQALPDEVRSSEIKHQSIAEMIEYLNRLYAGSAQFTPAPTSVVYRAHPKRLSGIAAEIARIDAPGVVLRRFPQSPRLPERLPDLEPVPLAKLGDPEWVTSLGDTLSTEIFTLEHIDVFLVKPYLEREITATTGARVLPDIRINALIVSAPESALPRLAAIVAYLDDKRWYQAPAPDENPAPSPVPTR